MGLSARIGAPMGDFQMEVFRVICSEVLLLVCLSTRIDAPTWNIQMGVFGVIW